MKNIILLFLVFSYNFIWAQTDRFLVTCSIPNYSTKSEILDIARGTIITVSKTDENNYQAFVICDLEDSSINYTKENGNIWRIQIPPENTLMITFTCYCLNKGLKPPNIMTGIHVTELRIKKSEVEEGCSGQIELHDLVEEKSNLLFEDETIVGVFNKTSSCIKAFRNALINLALEKFGIETIYNVKFNKNYLSKKLHGECKVEYDDVVSFGITEQSEEDIFIVNLRGYSKFDDGLTKFHLTYDLKPKESKREIIEKLILKNGI